VAVKLSQREQTVEILPIQHDVDVLIDPGRIEQVLNNLLDNASRYSEPGSIILIGVEIHEGSAVVSVTDDGQGIEEDDMGRIFEPFFRGARARERDASGTGLGLPISRGIIEAHGGEIGVDSVTGKGSTFNFYLPLARSSISPDKESVDISDARS
jgi:two-component system sensor histidine kinase ResE